MSEYFMAETPFGLLAVYPHANGGAYVTPAFGLDNYGRPIERLDDGTWATIEVNRVAYRDSFRVERSDGTGHSRWYTEGELYFSPTSFSDFTPAAQKKLQAWVESDWATVVTPERRKVALIREATSAEARAARKVEEARDAYKKAQADYRAAAKALATARAE